MLALDPTSTTSDKYFNAVVAYAIAQNISNPYFPLDQDAAEKQKEWLNDSMTQLIILVLTNDPSIDGTVRDELKTDLNNFMTEQGIDKNQAANIAAAEIIAKSSELSIGIVNAMSSVAGALSALSRCNGFKAATAAVNTALSKLPQGGGFPYLKGVFLLATVSCIELSLKSNLVFSNTSLHAGRRICLPVHHRFHQMGLLERFPASHRHHIDHWHGRGRGCQVF